ncbi:MAG: ATP-dependent helicase [bacterium]|nr:ATP-dependent helicase [bacterium]
MTISSPGAHGTPTPGDLRGPACLGRSVVVWEGQPAPEGWEGCPRVRLETPSGRRLRAAWADREPLVIEIADGEDLPDDSWSKTARWWELEPDFMVPAESLRFLAESNSVDARDPANPRFAPLERAVRLGARRSAPGEPGDAVSRSGQPLWCDGGPLAPFPAEDLRTGLDRDSDARVGVVPAANLAANSLAPIFPSAPAAELAADQLAAVAHTGGGARIVAPAGSGKTRVLTERARHLVKGLGVDPGAVCLVAYNKRAQEEMQDRLSDVRGLQVRTLNSLGLAICNGTGPFARPAGFDWVKTIAETDVRELLDGLLPPAPRRAMVDRIGPYIEALAATRLGLRDPVSVEAEYEEDAEGLASVAAKYADLLGERGQVDFDHQIIRAIEVLLADPDARRAARRVCSVMLVDEFQDLTPAHLLLVRLLAGPRADVFAVGDDDQTIYGYSGASPRWLIDYGDYFPQAARHDLHVNYRCPPEVVDAATSLLAHNADRLQKQITARPGRQRRPADSPDGPAIRTRNAEDPALQVRPHVNRLLGRGAQPGDIAVLCRVNSTLLAPQLALADMGVPSDRPVGPQFLARNGVAAALAWAEAATATGGIDPKTIEMIARRPPRGISAELARRAAQKRTAEELRELAEELEGSKEAYKIQSLVADIASLRRLAARPGTTTDMLLEAIRDDIGLGEAIDDRLDASRRSADRPSHADDLRALISVAGLHPRPAGFAGWLTKHLSEPAGNTPGGVRLATVHKVKGLEWPHVIVYDATEGLMPHSLAEDPEEERRVFHVAITRCSESVTVICGEDPSPYPAETRSLTPRAPTRNPEAPEPDRAPRPSTPGQRPTAPAPAPDGEPQTHPGTSWPVPSGRKRPTLGENRRGSGGRRPRR